MVKKKGISRTITAGAGIGVLLIVIIPVMFFVFGVGNAEVLPQDTDPDPFEIPIPCQEGQIRLPDGTCTVDITPIIEEPELFCEISESELQRISQCEILTRDEEFTSFSGDFIPDECSEVDLQSSIECVNQIEDRINELYASLIIPDPPEPNGTETSIDDPFTQLCDQDPTLIICGESRSLEIITRVLKTDSAGEQTTVETSFNIPFASLFVEDTSNIDFRTGQLQFEVQIKGDPDFRYSGTGKVDLLVGDQSLFLQPIDVKVDGIADEEGKVDLLFISPTGSTSDLFLFDFEDNFDKFGNEEITPVRLQVVELTIAGERDQDFALLNQDIFTMDIFRDDIQILIIDSEEIESRVYPSDSRIILTPRTSKSSGFESCRLQVDYFTSSFLGNGRGCTNHVLSQSIPSNCNGVLDEFLTVPAPTLTGISVLDSEGIIITTTSGSLDFRELTRNQNYTVKINSPNIQSSDLDYGKSQETKSFVCTQQGTPVVKSTASTGGSTDPCKTFWRATYQTATTVTLGSIQCTLPQENP